MNHRSNNSSIDWQELDRLVDGRLNENEYRELLCQVDADPNGWKQCALAFLEHQALEKELGAFAADPSCQLLPCMGAIVTEKKSGVEKSSLATKSVATRPANSMMGWLSMALCIVSGLAVGFTINSSFRDSTAPTVPFGSIVADMNAGRQGDSIEVAPSETLVGQVGGESSDCSSGNGSRDRCGDHHPCRNRANLETRSGGFDRHDPAVSDRCPITEHVRTPGSSCGSKN